MFCAKHQCTHAGTWRTETVSTQTQRHDEQNSRGTLFSVRADGLAGSGFLSPSVSSCFLTPPLVLPLVVSMGAACAGMRVGMPGVGCAVVQHDAGDAMGRGGWEEEDNEEERALNWAWD